MVKVGNQGLDDRCIRLRSHRTSYPGVGIASVSFDHVFETRGLFLEAPDNYRAR